MDYQGRIFDTRINGLHQAVFETSPDPLTPPSPLFGKCTEENPSCGRWHSLRLFQCSLEKGRISRCRTLTTPSREALYSHMHRLKKKKLIVFDLDKTLTESKQPMDDEMAELVRRLLEVTNVAVISGGSFKQFQKQFVPKLTKGKLASLFLFPTCGSALPLRK